MVLGPQGPGRVGRCQILYISRYIRNCVSAFFIYIKKQIHLYIDLNILDIISQLAQSSTAFALSTLHSPLASFYPKTLRSLNDNDKKNKVLDFLTVLF